MTFRVANVEAARAANVLRLVVVRLDVPLEAALVLSQ
jgi:hypothetical protein|tara:strand:+ start:437 stop:547 length:111 start_codon:yes stop_codon:yes gene_type:complete